MSIQGLDAFSSFLDALPDAMLDAAERGVKKALLLAVMDAKQNAPERSGQLRGSITSQTKREGDSVTGQVIVGAEHGIYVELGTGERGRASDNGKAPNAATYTEGHAGMAAQPYLYPAWKANEGKMIGIVAEEISKAGGGA